MKIGLLASYRGQKQYDKEHRAIIDHLQKRGHTVIHNMDTHIEVLAAMSYADREAIFMEHYKRLEVCEIVVAECSLQSTQVGFGLSYLRMKGKPIVMISKKGAQQQLEPKGEIYSNIEHLYIAEYDDSDLAEVLDDAVDYMSEQLDKRFTMIFPSELMARLEELSVKKKLPKAVFIRQLIEKSLAEDSTS